MREVARNVEGVVEGLNGMVEDVERKGFEEFWAEEWIVEG